MLSLQRNTSLREVVDIDSEHFNSSFPKNCRVSVYISKQKPSIWVLLFADIHEWILTVSTKL